MNTISVKEMIISKTKLMQKENTMSKERDQLSRISKTLIFSEPFYGIFLIGLNKQFSKNLPTAGVSKNGLSMQLAINPEFFASLSEKHQQGLLKHELLHIAFGHLLSRSRYKNFKLFNIAADIEINQYIDEDMLPEGGMTLDMFKELDLPVRAGTDVYYKLLEQDCDGEGGGEGKCEKLKDMLGDGKGQPGDPDDIHKTWKEVEDLPEAEKKLVQKQYEHQMKETAETIMKKHGNIPGELKDVIDRLFHVEPPKFNWKAYLRRFIGNATKVYTKKLRRKDNKRYAANPGLKIKFKNHICVGVDTSASVSIEELKEFMNEMYHMHKTGHHITVVQCDTEINSIEDFNPKKDWDIKGRGGTAFQPVIDHYNEPRNKYTALIYLTDGEAYAPNNCPANALWVHSTRSEINNNLPGFKIKLN
jgi:predicted metal-dependent peptidase